MANTIRAGRICGDPTCGLCERICIEVKKIYDGCVSKLNNLSFDSVPFTVNPVAPGVPPYIYVGAENSSNAILNDLIITSLGNSRVRVSYNAEFPLTIDLTDANGDPVTATATVVIPRDIILSVPPDRDYTVEIFGRFVSSIGRVNADSTVNIVACVAIITKIITITDVVIPIYGECVYPNCRPYEDERCVGLFSLPPFGG